MKHIPSPDYKRAFIETHTHTHTHTLYSVDIRQQGTFANLKVRSKEGAKEQLEDLALGFSHPGHCRDVGIGKR